MDKYFTWEFIGTFAGAVALVTLLVQWLKLPLDKLWKIPTRFWVYIISLAVLYPAQYFLGTLNENTAVLTLFNAVLVTMAAMGAYELTFAKAEAKKKDSKVT